MTHLIGRLLNSFPDWVIPFVLSAIGLIGVGVVTRWGLKRTRGDRPWTGTRIGGAAAVIALLLLAGVALFVDVVRPVYRAYRADGWPTATGTLRVCQLIPHRGDDDELDLHYTFVLDGQRFDGEWYDVSRVSGGDAESRRRIAREMPPGSSVTVHYNPRDADESVLTTTLPRRTQMGIWIAAGLFGLAAGAGTIAFKKNVPRAV